MKLVGKGSFTLWPFNIFWCCCYSNRMETVMPPGLLLFLPSSTACAASSATTFLSTRFVLSSCGVACLSWLVHRLPSLPSPVSSSWRDVSQITGRGRTVPREDEAQGQVWQRGCLVYHTTQYVHTINGANLAPSVCLLVGISISMEITDTLWWYRLTYDGMYTYILGKLCYSNCNLKARVHL